jgi:N-acetylmuramoyl-L-alanine amidase
VIVIDPGHGGLDAGTSAHGILEKDLTLVLARRLAATLEERLTAAVLLTRQQDRSLGLEERAGSANQNRADLLISLHVGYSEDPTESGGTVFLMREPAASGTRATGPAGLFRPWYEAWRPASDPSRAFALLVGDRLGSRLPEWPFRIREAPLGLLASVTMPAAILELGNANNPEDMTRLGTPAFQNRIIDAIVDAVQSLGTPERGNAP